MQTQVQSLELTIQTLGRYVAHLAERNIDLEIPQEIRRILQQLDDLEKQRRKPLFAERKIGKSVSVNSHLGFPLKVLEELNEREEHGSPQKTKKTPFFENTYEQLRQQRHQRYEAATSSGEDSTSPTRHVTQPMQRPNRLYDDKDIQTRFDELKLPEQVDRFMANIKSPLEVDSGVGTPLSPPSTSSNSSAQSSSSLSSGSLFSRIGYKNTPAVFTSPLTNRQTFTTTPTILTSPIKLSPERNSTLKINSQKLQENTTTTAKAATVAAAEIVNKEAMHPLSMVGEVNVKFNGTTQLKSIKPVHYLKSLSTSGALYHQTLPETETETETSNNSNTTSSKTASAQLPSTAKNPIEVAPAVVGGSS